MEELVKMLGITVEEMVELVEIVVETEEKEEIDMDYEADTQEYLKSLKDDIAKYEIKRNTDRERLRI